MRNPDQCPAMPPGSVTDDLRICIACHREFDLKTVDSRITHDKAWGPRDWDEGATTATSFLIPVDSKKEILDNLRRHPDVIFAEDPAGMADRRSSAPKFKP